MDPETDLADRLRTATAAAHRAVERTPFIRRMLRGEATPADHLGLLTALLPIYGALEAGLARHRGDPRLAWIDLAALRRAPAIARDLEHFTAPRPAAVPAALAYADHLHALADTAPALLIAHAYTRYLGDLAGGQVLRKLAARSLGLSEGPGLEFYAFPGDLDELRRAFRTGLASAPVDEREASAIVDEARLAFERHGELFAELAA